MRIESEKILFLLISDDTYLLVNMYSYLGIR
jgi:hypothetical protein